MSAAQQCQRHEVDKPDRRGSACITVWSGSDRVGFVAPGTPGNHRGNMVHAPGCAHGEVLHVDADGIHRTARLQSSAC